MYLKKNNNKSHTENQTEVVTLHGQSTDEPGHDTWDVGDIVWSARTPGQKHWLPADGKPRKRDMWPHLAEIAQQWTPDNGATNSVTALLTDDQKDTWHPVEELKVLFGEGNIFCMAAGSTVLVAAGKQVHDGKSKAILAFSYDGVHWTFSESASMATQGSRITDIAYGHQPDGSPLFIAGASNGMVAMSEDGANWTPCTVRARGSIQGVTYGLTKGNTQGLFMVLDQSGSVHTSENGQDWNSLNVTENAQIHSWLGNTLTWGTTGTRSGLFMAAPANRKIFASRDGKEWNYCHSDPIEHDINRAIRCMIWGRRDDGCGVFIAGCNNGRAILSENGHMWNVQDTPLKHVFCATWVPMADGGSLFIIGGYGKSSLAVSTDGWTWKSISGINDLLQGNNISALMYANGKLFVGGSGGFAAMHDLAHKPIATSEVPVTSLAKPYPSLVHHDPESEFITPYIEPAHGLSAYIRAFR